MCGKKGDPTLGQTVHPFSVYAKAARLFSKQIHTKPGFFQLEKLDPEKALSGQHNDHKPSTRIYDHPRCELPLFRVDFGSKFLSKT